MPTSYPFPTIARLALSLYASARKVERLPVIREYEPHETVLIVSQTQRSLVRDPMITGEYL